MAETPALCAVPNVSNLPSCDLSASAYLVPRNLILGFGNWKFLIANVAVLFLLLEGAALAGFSKRFHGLVCSILWLMRRVSTAAFPDKRFAHVRQAFCTRYFLVEGNDEGHDILHYRTEE